MKVRQKYSSFLKKNMFQNFHKDIRGGVVYDYR